MNEAPRPLNLGEILDRTISLYRARFLVFLGISAVPTVVVLAIASGAFLFFAWFGSFYRRSSSPAEISVYVGIMIVALAALVLPVFLGSSALASAAMTEAVNRAYLDEKTTIRGAYQAVWKLGWRYVGLYGLQALIVWGVPIGAWVGMILLSAAMTVLARTAGLDFLPLLTGISIFLAAIGLIAYTAWMLLRLSLAFPAGVIEQIGAWAALKRSSALSQGTRWRVLALYLLTAVLTWILSFGLAMIATVVMMLIPGTRNAQQAQTLGMVLAFVYYGAGFVTQALTKPVFGIALVLFYYDQRIRKEGFDIEWMMQRAGMVEPAIVAPAGEIAPPWMAADGLTTAPMKGEPLASTDRDLSATEETR